LTETPRAKGVILGVACGVGAAAFWAAGFVAARHGIAAGLSPFDIAFHRFVWAGLFFLPGVLRRGIGRLNGIGWRRGLLLAMLGGPFQAIIVSASGFLLVPLAHGGVVQPSVMVLTGLLLATLILRERQPPGRIYGAAMIIAGIAVIGGEAVTSTGGSGVLGDAAFALAGARRVRLRSHDRRRLVRECPATRAQGVFSGPGAIYLFARSVALLGASRATVFPSLVPGLTLLIGFLVLGEAPSFFQLFGLAAVLIGFRLTQA
jgi:drug/metabolite transporter (DMT)-like permease